MSMCHGKLPRVLMTWLVLSVCGASASLASEELPLTVTENTTRLMPYQVFELTFQHPGEYADPTWAVTIETRFTSPSGRRAEAGGFFYGSSKPSKPIITEHTDRNGRKQTTATWPCDPADLWKARYVPSELGRWTYQYKLSNRQGQSTSGRGTFDVVKGRTDRKGWVRIHASNPFMLVFENGGPFFPVGFQDGIFDNNHNGSTLDAVSMEGPFRLDPQGVRPTPPPGALFARGPSMNPTNADVHFGRLARAGFNFWRFSPNNFSMKVFSMDGKDGPTINWQEAAMVDELLLTTGKYGMRNLYGIFGYTHASNDRPQDARAMARAKQIIKYSVDRWGAYVDIWELFNEQKAAAEWYAETVPYLKSIDPYHKPVTTSWERPELDGIDVNAPHWYGNENELQSDAVTAARAKSNKRFAKPVVYGEQGNYRGQKDRSAEGIGGVWDPGSARRMRVRLWTAMFNQISFIFWETSYAKDGHVRNIWLGPEERQYVRVLQDLAYRLDAEVRPAEVALAGASAKAVRCYGLGSDRRMAVYLHHFVCRQCAERTNEDDHGHRWDHRRGDVRGLQLTVDVPIAGKAYWIDPRNAAVVESLDVSAGQHTLTAPPFEIDLALLITDGAAPDIDGDGRGNNEDTDDDNDGVPDAEDAFPLEREEWADRDADRIGDNYDADVDADGKADDRNRNGTPDNEETDPDGDGVPTANAVPWDAFPNDPKEWRDTDGDGLGDNADKDDDGDGFSDDEERRAGTDPVSAVSFPVR